MRIDSIVEAIVASQGNQVRRKDKDLMSDTGGTSKVREREPQQKPPRDDMKNPYRTKDTPSKERDRDTQQDDDMKVAGFFGFLPPPTYADRVASGLVHILAESRGVSEKAFDAYDEIMREAKETVAVNMEAVMQFESVGQRPEYCAEYLYANAQNGVFAKVAMRIANGGMVAKMELARYPATFHDAMRRG